MRASIRLIILFCVFASGCFVSRNGSDDDPDSGASSISESGVSDSSKTNSSDTDGTVASRDARIDVESHCGNNIKEEGEACDGTDLDGLDCETIAIQIGTLRCKPDCLNFDTSMCHDYPLPGRDDDAGVEEVRIPRSGRCARAMGGHCESDEDCVRGGCSGEICMGPDAEPDMWAMCGCTVPAEISCGCVSGGCVWWTSDPEYRL